MPPLGSIPAPPHGRPRRLLTLAAATVLGSTLAAQANVLLIVADDLGVDALGFYQEASDYPVTPVLDDLRGQGMIFRNAWSNPNCSPTRAALLTGRYGFRTGIGDHIPESASPALPLDETTLPELLDLAPLPYATGAFGKWHLGNVTVGGLLAPNMAGFDHFDGSLRNSFEVPPPPNWINYFNWPRVQDGVYSVMNFSYATTINVNAAIEWINQQSEPWFCNLWFHAPHEPFHKPPPALYSEPLQGLDPTLFPRPHYKAAIEAIDSEIGRLLAGIGTQATNTLVIFLGDNGTPSQVVVPPFSAGRAKGTLYEGGVNVPLLVAGPPVTQAGAECQALVNVSDLFATIAEVAGVDPATALPGTTLDSVSLVPYFTDANRPSQRSWAFAERFTPNGKPDADAIPLPDPTPPSHIGRLWNKEPGSLEEGVHVQMNRATRAIRDTRYKLIFGATTEFYDLVADPFETQNLLDRTLTPQESACYEALALQMRALLLNP